MDNRRVSDRCPTNLACRLNLHAGRATAGRIVDLSRDGICIEFTGTVAAWDGPRVLCYLNGYLLERALDVRWTRVETDRVVVGAQFHPGIPHVLVEQFVRYAAWQAQATEPVRLRRSTRRINPAPAFSRDRMASGLGTLRIDPSVRGVYASRRRTT